MQSFDTDSVKSDYQQLKQTLIKEFSDPEFEFGLIIALDTKQGHHESPEAFYNWLRQAYFGAHNEPEMEEDASFKILFFPNLHPIVSHHFGIKAYPCTVPIQHLCDIMQMAFNKHKVSPKRYPKVSEVLSNIQNSQLTPEGT